MHIAVVSTRREAPAAALSIRAAATAVRGSTLHVLDVDGWYLPVGREQVTTPGSLGLSPTTVHRLAASVSHGTLVRRLQGEILRALASSGGPIVLLTPGVVLLREPLTLLEEAGRHGLGTLARAPHHLPDDGLWPDEEDVAREGRTSPVMLAVQNPSPDLLTMWLNGDPDWLDAAARRTGHQVADDPALLLSPWNLGRSHRVVDDPDGLTLDGRPVTALDLSAVDAHRPWLLDRSAAREPRGRLSDHPILARRVNQAVEEMLARPDAPADVTTRWDMTTTSLGYGLDPALRWLYGRDGHTEEEEPPDPFDPASAAHLRAWLTEPADGVARYLLGLHRARPDLRAAFPMVPGPDTPGFVQWVQRYSRDEGCPEELVDAALRRMGARLRTPRPQVRRLGPPVPGMPEGVTVVGFLRGGLGLGESARLMVQALDAVGTPHSTVAISPPQAGPPLPDPTLPPAVASFDTSLICVNADVTPAVVDATEAALGQSYRIGMWYWEAEDFPAAQHGAFPYLDEIWVATDFVRRAIEPHAPVPVRTVTPPLPQRGHEPVLTRAELGLPEGFLFLFSFDFLSTAERKNPWGLVEAFRTAFAPGAGPTLVIKSINGEHRPADAERLRLAVAGHPDVVLLERYLEPTARDALVALSDCYVSLHRSEGLGLTMAEAMAWGKPVIATGYGGNLEFMSDENSFLVPWLPTTILPGAEPYPPGGRWAAPDLAAAAAALRLVVDRPDIAAARGSRAAADIAALHSPEAAGLRIARRLAEVRRRRARTTVLLGARLRDGVERVRRAARRSGTG